MKIYEFCPFFNENRIAEIKIKENSSWVDELHIVESNRSFNCEEKPYNFDKSLINKKVIYHQFNSDSVFRVKEETNKVVFNKKIYDEWYWRWLNDHSVMYNESIQRNLCTHYLFDIVRDDDIVILSDFDEIIDNRFAEEIINKVKKNNIITIKLYYSAFYLNIFCSKTMPGHSPDHSYRLFIMTGRFFKSMPISSDLLRKKGTDRMLSTSIYCLKETAGFHHTFLDFENTLSGKAGAWKGFTNNQYEISKEYIDKCIKNKRLYYRHTKLYLDNNKFLKSINDIDTTGLWYEK
jgi:hypothetical protein